MTIPPNSENRISILQNGNSSKVTIPPNWNTILVTKHNWLYPDSGGCCSMGWFIWFAAPHRARFLFFSVIWRSRKMMIRSMFHNGYPLVNCHITMEIHHIFNGEINYNYQWQFSIVMLKYQGVIMCDDLQYLLIVVKKWSLVVTSGYYR